MNIPRKHDMDREDEEEMNIYANVDSINSSDVRTETENSNTTSHQTPQHTGSDTVRNRISRAAPVCLVLLCVLLLTAVTAVIVLCVHINTKSTNYTEETRRLLTKITNLTKERDQLLTKNTDLTKERDQLLTKNTDLTKERDQLLTKNTDLTKEKEQLQIRNTDLTKEKEQLQIRNTDLTKEKDQLNKEKNELSKSLREKDGWIYYKSSLYFFSSEKKSWTESRRYCTDRGADLTIIHNREEQDFVRKISADVKVWIGLTDSDVEGTWTWVDGSSPQTSGFRVWLSGEPNGNGMDEDCALNDELGWADYPCSDAFQWICEKVILK